MPYLILGVILLGGLLLAARVVVNADPAKLSRILGWFAAGLGVAGAGARADRLDRQRPSRSRARCGWRVGAAGAARAQIMATLS